MVVADSSPLLTLRREVGKTSPLADFQGKHYNQAGGACTCPWPLGLAASSQTATLTPALTKRALYQQSF